MAAIASSSSFCSQKHKHLSPTTDLTPRRSSSFSSLLFPRQRRFSGSSSWTAKGRVVLLVSSCSWSSSSFDELHARGRPRGYPTSKKEDTVSKLYTKVKKADGLRKKGRQQAMTGKGTALCLFGRQENLVSIDSEIFATLKQNLCTTGHTTGSENMLMAGGGRKTYSMNSILLNLIQEIEPLDVSVVQKEVPSDTIDAMKRTISSMLGLLPSDQFRVLVDASWGSLSKLLISSIMTGYTMRNAEHRLCLERSLDIHEQSIKNEGEHAKNSISEPSLGNFSTTFPSSGSSDTLPEENHVEQSGESMELDDLGETTSEVKEYIEFLQSRLSSVKKELCDMKRKNSALEMQQHFIGEEKNDLLNYLRSLQPEKVVELSEPCQEVEEAVHSVVHGLLATLSPKMHSKSPPQSENSATGILGDENDDPSEVVENTAFHFEPLISLSRDYLARLLFWCMLLGHFLRGLEYRLELMQLLALVGEVETTSPNSDPGS